MVSMLMGGGYPDHDQGTGKFGVCGSSRRVKISRKWENGSGGFVSRTALFHVIAFHILSSNLLLTDCKNIDDEITFASILPDSSRNIQHTDIPGAFQFRDILFVQDEESFEDSFILSSSNHLYKVSLSSMREIGKSTWLPSSEFTRNLALNDPNEWWVSDNRFCNNSGLVLSQFDQTKVQDEYAIYGITCRWYFYAMSQVDEDGKFWTCFSKQTMSGCIQFKTSLEVTGKEVWPVNSTDEAFLGSYPDHPWLTTWQGSTVISFIGTEQSGDSKPTFSFVGNSLRMFSVSMIDNKNPFFSKLFGNSQSYPVGSFIIGNYQYVFFHDNANEARSSYYDFDQPEKEYRRFSRVARFCINSFGSQSVRSSAYLVMARLLCGISKGSYNESEKYQFDQNILDYHYLVFWNVITDVDFDSKNNLFYATFNQYYLPKGLTGAAVCAFNKSNIDRVLDSQKLKKPRSSRADSHLSWQLQSNTSITMPANFSHCRSSDQQDLARDERLSNEFLPLMHEWVEPVARRPIAYSLSYNFQTLAVDVYQNYTQLYVTTDKLNLLKLTVDNSSGNVQTTTSHFINLPNIGAQVFEKGLFDDNFTYFVRLKDNYVYVGSTWTVYKAPRNLCHLYTTCLDCLQTSRDPECLWNPDTQNCEGHVGAIIPEGTNMTNQVASCPNKVPTEETSYHVAFLPPLLRDQAPEAVFAASEVTLFCGANFSISKHFTPGQSSTGLQSSDIYPPEARWYENSRDVSSQSVGKCGTNVGVNTLSCFDPVTTSIIKTEQIGPSLTRKTVTGFSYSLLKVAAQKTANYTCVFHYSPKDFTSDSVVLKVLTRKEQADQLYTKYLEELRQFYTRKCEIDAYCETDGCKSENERRFQSCLNQQITAKT